MNFLTKCFHIEHRTRTVTSGSGKHRRTHTEHYSVTVTTFVMTSDVNLSQALDMSDQVPDWLQSHNVCEVDCTSVYELADAGSVAALTVR